MFGYQIFFEIKRSRLAMAIKTFRLILTFYKSFALASILLTLCCLSIIFKWGATTFTVLFWFKIFTLGIILYHINTYKKDEFLYYKNLGISKKLIMCSCIIIDIFLFLILALLTNKLR